MAGSGIKGLNINSEAFSDALTVASGGITGGISSTIAGGDFWRGMRHGLITTGLNHTLHKFTTPIFDNGYEKDGKGGYKQISTEGGNDTDHLYENGVKIESREVSSSPHELTKRSYGIKAGSPNLIEVDIIGTAIGGRAAITGLWNLGKVTYNTLRFKPLGLGHTGRSIPQNLTEQLAMKEIISNPNLGKVVMKGMKDSRWAGWNKMQYTYVALNGAKITIHYVGKFKNGILKAVDDFKFK